MVNFTNDDVIAYIYNELPIDSFYAFEKALETNWALQEKVAIIRAVKMRLNELPVQSPSQSCIDRIMAYATAPVATV